MDKVYKEGPNKIIFKFLNEETNQIETITIEAEGIVKQYEERIKNGRKVK